MMAFLMTRRAVSGIQSFVSGYTVRSGEIWELISLVVLGGNAVEGIEFCSLIIIEIIIEDKKSLTQGDGDTQGFNERRATLGRRRRSS
jgi:hypothetical protein